ncbi:cell wall-binding repeat-containing protein [Desulfosporosinus metallidurans]|uniref:N-acetylmuramoyl-L-alanine amidase n=1 Tax=Desulfosporosinus metallidurans TaxID=1888891 RepID=A0A1Q8QF49_9FIRM|nr:cell wall-binding repeat-containing protein [Desulfosporosinus metallidurans]OLN25912.1 N-acetylmuramoyl-L-alanine amidase [Desulfosporosinus metallidurans]
MKKTKVLASLTLASLTISMLPFNAFANVLVPTRLAGGTAAQTAVQIADQTGWTGTAILASSTSYGMVDALAAGPLAYSLKAPILLTGAGATLDADTKKELTKLAVKTVYVTSGTAVISQGVLEQLSEMGITVIPLGGVDRAATSVNIAKKMTGVTKVAVVNGLQDALSIAAVASAANEPILLTDKAALPASVSAYLATNPGITSSDVIGGKGIISEAVMSSLPKATRHAGTTAYDTNAQVIQDFSSVITYSNVFVANGRTGIDALAGAPLAAMTKSAIVLTEGTVPAVASLVHDKLATDSVVTAIGGEAVVPESVRKGILSGVATLPASQLSVARVNAVSASSFKVVFNQAPADSTKVTFTVKNMVTPVTVSPTWNSAKTEAILTSSANFSEGTYSVAVKNGDTDLGTSKVDVAAQKIAEIKITSTKLGVVTNSSDASKQTGYATYLVLDQYQNDITCSGLANNIIFQSGVGSVEVKDGLLTVTPNTTNSNLMQFSTVVITGYDSTSGVSVTSTLTTSTQIGTLSDFQLGDLKNADGKVLTDGDSSSIFYANYTAKDISGNPTTDYQIIMNGLILHGDAGATGNEINQLTTSHSYVKATIEKDPTDSTKAVVKVVASSANTSLAMDMPTVITAMTWTGKTSTLTTTLKKASTADTFILMAPANSIAVGENKEIPFSCLDQNGAALTKMDDIKGITLSGAHFEANVDGTAKVIVGDVNNYGIPNDGQQVITATTSTGKFSSLTLNIQKRAVADTLTFNRSAIINTMQAGAVQRVDMGYLYGGLSVKDQYGRAIDMVNEPQTYAVYATSSTAAGAAINLSQNNGLLSVTSGSPLSYGNMGIQIEAANVGTGTVTFNLVDTAQKKAGSNTETICADPANPTAAELASLAIIDSKSVTISVLAADSTDIKGYTISPVAKPLYAAALKGTTPAAITWQDNAYDANPFIYGTTASGSKVVLASNTKAGKPLIVGKSVDSTDFNIDPNEYTLSKLGYPGQGVGRITIDPNGYDSIFVSANALPDNVTQSSCNLTVTIKGADGAVHALTTVIKSTTENPAASNVGVTADASYDGISVSDDGNTVYLTPAVSTGNSSGNTLAVGKCISRFDAAGGKANRSLIYFYAKDQYTAKGQSLAQIFVVPGPDNAADGTVDPDNVYTYTAKTGSKQTYTRADASAFTVDQYGTITANNLKAGDFVVLTGVSKNGLLKTIRVVVLKQ